MLGVLLSTATNGVAQQNDTYGESPGATVVSSETLRVSTKTVASIVSGRLKRMDSRVKKKSSKMGARGKKGPQKMDSTDSPAQRQSQVIHPVAIENGMGISASDSEQKFGAWANMALANFKDKRSDAKSDTDLFALILGVDYKLSDNVAVGLAASYERSVSDTYFNSGDIDFDGIGIVPYFAVSYAEFLSFQVVGGHTWLDIDQKGNFINQDGDEQPGVTSSLDSRRMFVSTYLNGYYSLGNFDFNGHVGYLYAHEKQDSYTESNGENYPSRNLDYANLSAGVECSYFYGIAEPFFGVAYKYDTRYEETPGVDYGDRDEFDLKAGVRFMDNNFEVDLEGKTVLGRANYDEYSIVLSMRYSF